jgi:16S rRNA (cytosine1402-N4)-methyltransferase
VNHELENLERVLKDIPRLLRPGGRVAIISFHSLEDRLVKRAMQRWKKENIAELITRKPVVASARERAENPRSRSAKLRAAKMK